jgi:uncharacterized protein (DUF2235 family)
MSKTIVVCADGTWDSPQSATNVYKLWKALPITATQIPFYDDGVGADGTPLQRLTGGALGDGIFQKIKDGYTKLSHVYEAGDEIFIFGFSRGAYTARSLAGMVAICGLPTGPFDETLVEQAFQAYRNAGQRGAILASLAKYNLYDAKITMVGVWDTVGSLGIPAIVGGVSPLIYGFLDTGLHPDVMNAYHALSIDERRIEFPPTLWTSAPAPGQTLEQVWFAGVHCDVGGGYPETGLSDITLGWMMGKARALGLDIDDAVWADYAAVDAKHALDQAHESWTPIWGFPRPRSVPPDAALSNSVAIRHANGGYAPGTLAYNGPALAGGYRVVPIVQPAPPPPP